MQADQIVIFEPDRDKFETLGALGRKLFAQTFAGLYCDEDLQRFLSSTFSVSGLQADISAGCSYWAAKDVSVENRPWVGYCKVGPVKVPLATMQPLVTEKSIAVQPVETEHCLELRQLYIDRCYHRHGIGSQFMNLFFRRCADLGVATAYVSCWSENHQALRFYERFGFTPIGEYEFPVGEHLDREFVLRKQLSPPDDSCEIR